MKGLNEKYLKELELEKKMVIEKFEPVLKYRYDERFINNENINKKRLNRTNQILFG